MVVIDYCRLSRFKPTEMVLFRFLYPFFLSSPTSQRKKDVPSAADSFPFRRGDSVRKFCRCFLCLAFPLLQPSGALGEILGAHLVRMDPCK